MNTAQQRHKLRLMIASTTVTVVSAIVCTVGVFTTSQPIKPAAPEQAQQVVINPYWGTGLGLSVFGALLIIGWYLAISKRQGPVKAGVHHPTPRRAPRQT